MSAGFTAAAAIKLVIWDLDDTFWTGTLSEGSISLIESNLEIVKTLVGRGIMSSIASKNDYEPVKKALIDAGVWDLFIFPQISWNPKGGSIATIIEQANLRPDNVLFVDDNSLNIEEIRFRFPTMMVAYPEEVLPVLLGLDQAKGKDDRAHSRLSQYKQLEKKVSDQQQTTLNNEDFLRQCEIKLRFEYDVNQHIDRIIELINRSNQLNFTKVRLETPEAVDKFRADLDRHDVFSAGIFASDRYGSHGLIGFYMQHKNERGNKLLHFVWSCRMMNAGLEQYVYERLGNPDITVVNPVSNPIKAFSVIDWISETAASKDEDSSSDPSLLLIGSCDLTAVASYCSRNRVEFVNGVKNGVMTRFDDFGFILGDGKVIERSSALEMIPAWGKQDHADFHSSLATSEILVVSLSAAIRGVYMVTSDGVVMRVHPEGLGNYIDFDNPSAAFLKGAEIFAIDDDISSRLLIEALDSIDQSGQVATHKFLLGANTREPRSGADPNYIADMKRYNELCEEFCRSHKGWQFVSIDNIVSQEKLIDDRHYNRIGYFDIATFINERIIESNDNNVAEQLSVAQSKIPIADTIRAGKKLSRFALFGAQKGILIQIKKAVKRTPIGDIIKASLQRRKSAA